MDNQQILLHHRLQKYLVARGINFISVSLRCLLQRSVGKRIDKGRGQAVQAGLSCPAPRISERTDIQHILLHHLNIHSEIFSWKGYTLYFSQSETLTSNVQLDYVLSMDGGGGGNSPGWFILPSPPPRASERMDNQQFLLHHLLQKYLFERDINFIWDDYFKRSVGLRIGWGQAVQAGLSYPPPRISERMDNQQILLHHLLQKYLV